MNGTNVRLYYRLIKPGIVYGNILTAIAGFVFAVHHASDGRINIPLLFATVFGLGLSIASGCVLNNIIDRDIDARMERTKERALVQKRISIKQAGIFAVLLGVTGLGLLAFYTNIYALLATVFGMVVYVLFYTPLKRETAHSTIIGAFAGAVPPLVGYVAVAGDINATALILFLILVCWQMPHFFAIALYRLDEYKNANLPVMPLYVGIFRTQLFMAVYAFLFVGAVLALAAVEKLGLPYILLMGISSLGWFAYSLSGFRVENTARWARIMFFYSLVLLLLFSALLVLV